MPPPVIATRGPARREKERARGLTCDAIRLFRRSLLMADTLAFVAAAVVVSQFWSRPLQLTWVSVCGLMALLLGAKIFGLYDRDEALLHKTTLDEAPKFFQVATLGALCA